MAWLDPFDDFGGYSSEEERFHNWGYADRQGHHQHHQYQQRNVKQIERWACGRCHKDYASKANLDRHMASDHGPKPKAIQQRGGQQGRGGRGRGQQARGGQVVPWSQQNSNFTCQFCGNDYTSQGNLNRHVTSCHLKNGQVSVASSSTSNTVNIVYNVYNQNFYNCKKY